MTISRKEYIKKQLVRALSCSVTCSSFLGVFISLIPFREKWWINASIILAIFIMTFTITACILLLKKKRTVRTRNNISFSISYGDLLDIKRECRNGKPVVVIPVNSSFDSIVEDDLSVPFPIVSSTTLHGKWILKLTNNDKNASESLRKDIDRAIVSAGLKPEKVLSNKRGNTDVYKLGSAIFVERDDCGYMLFALSEFDENNHVIEQNRSAFPTLMVDLIDATSRCQARDVFIPVMGVGLSLFGLEYKQALDVIKTTILNKMDSLKSSITIVIYDDDRDKISIYD